MHKLLLPLLCLCLISPAFAKKVSDRTHTFSFEAPDNWLYTSPAGAASKIPNSVYLARPDKKCYVGIRGIKSYKKSQPNLDQWADLTATLFSTVTQQPTQIMEWKADSEPARIMNGLFGSACQSTALITQKNGCAAMMLVISENYDTTHMDNCKKFFDSFHWEE